MAYLYPLLKSLHLIAVIAWLAGLLYLPRLFVYHAECPADDARGRERFNLMETRLYRRIMGPAMMAAVLLGLALLGWFSGGLWIVVKIALVVVLIAYHVWCGRQIKRLAAGGGLSGKGYRWLNEVPAGLLVVIVLLAVFKPF